MENEISKELVEKAKTGDRDAQYELGCLYCEDPCQCFDEDREHAMLWLGQAAEQGDDRAMHMIGLLHFHDEYTASMEFDECIVWYRKAADRDNPMSQYELAWMYGGDCRAGMSKRAILLIESPAEGESPDMYWLKKAVSGHYPLAVNCMAQKLFDEGDFKLSYVYSKEVIDNMKSDSLACIESYRRMARMCAEGKGVDKSVVQAIRFLRAAVGLRSEDADLELKGLEKSGRNLAWRPLRVISQWW